MREGYEQVIVSLRAGEPLAGFVRGETADELVLEDAEGARHRVRKADVVRREQSRVSIMPEGLQAGLSLQEFADLVAYLESLR
jgi:putative heme-binding domain-containing protein